MTDERPLVCELCGRVFERKQDFDLGCGECQQARALLKEQVAQAEES